MPSRRAHGFRWKSLWSATPAATCGCASWRSRARGPAPSRSIASRFNAQASEAGPYRPATSGSIGSIARASGDYERFAPDIARGYRLLGLPPDVDAVEVGRRELRWWVVRREIGLSAGAAAGEAITRLYAALYELPDERVAEAGRLRGEAAEVRDRGASADPGGPTARGLEYWPEVARLLRQSYRELHAALAAE